MVDGGRMSRIPRDCLKFYLAATEIDLSDFYHKVKSLQSDSDLIDNLFLAERLGSGPMNRAADIGIRSAQDCTLTSPYRVAGLWKRGLWAGRRVGNLLRSSRS